MHLNRVQSLLRRIYSYALRSLAPTVQRLLRLDKLNSTETSGFISNFTKLKLSSNFRLELPYSLGRTIRGLDYSICNLDVFLQALEDQRHQEFDLKSFSFHVASVYSEELLFTVSDKIPIANSSALGSLPLWAMAYPWECQSPYDKLVDYPENVIENRSSYLKYSPKPRGKFLDPDSFGMSHAIQFSSLLSSIEDKGFQPSSSFPCVYILRSGKQWRWIMSGSGNHRAYILNYLNYQSLPAQIIGVINRDHLHRLPLVRNGDFTLRVAEHIFDSVFAGSTSLRGIM